jgi:divalent metal cation (Fe/Co/Zn/Cd) transporter
MLFEGGTWFVALREFNREKGELGYLAAIRESKDPTTFTVLIEDTVALLGLVIALIGISAAQILDRPELDGAASIGIGVLLAGVALFLARESKNLLIGEPALPVVQQAILLAAQADEDIRHVNGVSTAQLGPHVAIAMLSAEFEDHLQTPAIEACIERVEASVRERYPELVSIFVKPQTEATWRARVAAIRKLGG